MIKCIFKYHAIHTAWHFQFQECSAYLSSVGGDGDDEHRVVFYEMEYGHFMKSILTRKQDKIHQHFCGYHINFESLSYLNFEWERIYCFEVGWGGWLDVPVCIKHFIVIPIKKRFIICTMNWMVWTKLKLHKLRKVYASRWIAINSSSRSMTLLVFQLFWIRFARFSISYSKYWTQSMRL